MSPHKTKLDENGNLVALNAKNNWQPMICPFRSLLQAWVCGTGCPHFSILEGGVVELTCGGRERIIYLGGADVGKNN